MKYIPQPMITIFNHGYMYTPYLLQREGITNLAFLGRSRFEKDLDLQNTEKNRLHTAYTLYFVILGLCFLDPILAMRSILKYYWAIILDILEVQ